MLEIKNISKSYGTLKAVDNLSFVVNDGEIFGLLGLNGAGKTTTFRIINKLLDPEEGVVLLNGKHIDYSVTDNIGFLTEERSLLTKLTVFDQAIYYGILKGLDEKTIEEKLDFYLDKFNIKDYKYKKVKELSKGNQQKIQFITAVLHEPKLLILDEPFSGLDPINVELFENTIIELKNKGTSIIFSTHRMEHVEKFCEKLVILVRGKSVLDGYLKDIKKSFRKKNIVIKGDANTKELKEIDGVIGVKKNQEYIEVKIKGDEYIKNVFDYIKKCGNITRFEVMEPSLNEIFIDKVGEAYEK